MLPHQLSLQNTDGKCCVSAGTGRPAKGLSLCAAAGKEANHPGPVFLLLGALGEDSTMYLKILAHEVPHYWSNHGVHGPQALRYQE